MRLITAYIKIILLVSATLSLYAFWMIGRPFAGTSGRWRAFIYRTWAQLFVFLLRMRVEVVGSLPSRPFFLVCNHTGYVDIPAIRVVLDGVFVAKHEISAWPVAGRIIGDMGNIFINRENRRDIPRAGEAITKRLKEGEGVIVFAEGTSSDGTSVLPLRSSFLEFAARSDIPIHYATLHYETGVEGKPASKAVAWADLTPLGTHMRNLFSLNGFRATITFGERPVTAGDRKVLAKSLQAAIEEIFVPLK